MAKIDWQKHLRSLAYSVIAGAVAGFAQWTQSGEFATLSTWVAMLGSYVVAQSDKLLRQWLWPDGPPPTPPAPPVVPPSDGGAWPTAPVSPDQPGGQAVAV